MTPREYAGWLADKIPAYGDYAKEAGAVLVRQADDIEALQAENVNLRDKLESLESGLHTYQLVRQGMLHEIAATLPRTNGKGKP